MKYSAIVSPIFLWHFLYAVVHILFVLSRKNYATKHIQYYDDVICLIKRKLLLYNFFFSFLSVLLTSGNLASSSTQNGHKGTSFQGDSSAIASPARRSEVSPIQSHVSVYF